MKSVMIRVLLFLLAVQFACAAVLSKPSSKSRIGEHCEDNGVEVLIAGGIRKCLDHRWVWVCPTGEIFYDQLTDCSPYGPTVPYPPTTEWWPTTPNPFPTWPTYPPTIPTVPTIPPYPDNSCSPLNTGLIRLSGYENLVYLSCDQKPVNGIQTCVVREPSPFKK